MTKHETHATVIGASVAGLLAAAAIADRFDRVTILEREVLPPPGRGRTAVPQGRHVHALLPGGLAAIEELLPGFGAELVAGGAVRCDSMKQIRVVLAGHPLTRDGATATNLLASRPFIEGHLRRRVLALPNITIEDGTTVRGLVPGAGPGRVPAVETAEGVVTGDLVVAAAGRAGQLPAWLEKLGFPVPAQDALTVNIHYASRHVRIPEGALGDRLILVSPRPGHPRGLGLFAQEDRTWLLTLVGYGSDHRPPTDERGYLAFLATVAPPDVLEAVSSGEFLDHVVTHAFPASRRRRYERLERYPQGLVAIGDAISSFNPVYGQGMSVAALQAVALRKALSAGEVGLPQRYFKAAGRIVDVAWDLAVGSDLSLPEVEGARPLLTRLSNAWAERILRAAEHDPYVAEVFGSVTDLIAPPSVLVRPRFVSRVALCRLGRPRRRPERSARASPARGLNPAAPAPAPRRW